MASIDGKSIADCFSVAAQVGVELNSMIDTLSNLFLNELKGRKLPFKIAGETREANETDESGWINLCEARSFPLKPIGKGAKNPKRHLGFQISMTGGYISIPENTEPLIYVFSYSDPVNFDDCYMAFPLSESNDDDTNFSVIDDRLVCWGNLAAGWDEIEWTFAVNLLAMQSSSDLKKYIVEPAIALLHGAKASEAIPTDWLDTVIVRLPEKEKLVTS